MSLYPIKVTIPLGHLLYTITAPRKAKKNILYLFLCLAKTANKYLNELFHISLFPLKYLACIAFCYFIAPLKK